MRALFTVAQGSSVAAAVLAYRAVCRRAVLVCGRVPVGERLARGPLDVLVLNGADDRFVRPDDVRADLASSFLGGQARHVVLPGLGHEFNNIRAGDRLVACGGRSRD